MRADRLLQIMLLLQTRGGMTSKELAMRLEVSERTIFRDMEALSSAGVPVYADRGANGGWRLTEGYRADWAGLRKDELLSLLATKPHRHLTDLGFGNAYEAAVLKVLASLTPTQRRDADYMRQRVYVDAAGWHPSGEEVPWLGVAQEAVWEGRKLRLQYVSAGNGAGADEKERVLNPLGLVLKGSLWYLIAARDGQEPHSYRVSRIRSAEVLDEAATRPDNFDLSSYWHESVDRFRSELPRYPVRALVHASVGGKLEITRFARIVSWLNGTETTDGWREAELEFHTLESACEIVLGFGAKLRIVEPAELREALCDAARGIASLYEGK